MKLEKLADDILLQLDHHPNDRKYIIGSLEIFRASVIDEVITYISNKQGWEESEDIYRAHFGLKTKYK